ncbi:MAG: prepilin-type N-terminal cleavage/methylation domain-containing protein [Verrucomicrobiota bacterium]
MIATLAKGELITGQAKKLLYPRMKTSNTNRGFTLLELLCVVAFIAILLGLYGGVIQRSYRYCMDTLSSVKSSHRDKLDSLER